MNAKFEKLIQPGVYSKKKKNYNCNSYEFFEQSQLSTIKGRRFVAAVYAETNDYFPAQMKFLYFSHMTSFACWITTFTQDQVTAEKPLGHLLHLC